MGITRVSFHSRNGATVLATRRTIRTHFGGTVVTVPNMDPYSVLLRNAATAGVGAGVKISALTEEASPAAGDWILGEDDSGVLVKIDAGNIAGGTGQWTLNGSDLHPNAPVSAKNVLVGGTTAANSDIVLLATGGAVFNETGADADFRIESDNQQNMFFVDASSDRIGLCTATPGATDASNRTMLDLSGNAILLGSDSGLRTRTDATNKVGIFIGPHYDNAEEPVMGMFLSNISGENRVIYGGGSANYNAATDIRFYSAANSTTLTGTEVARITSTGFGIGVFPPTEALDVLGNIKGTGTLTIPGTTTFNTVAYTWPAADGTSGQHLSTDGAGTLSWASAPGTTEFTVTTTDATQTVIGSIAVASGTSKTFTIRGHGREDATGDTHSIVIDGCIRNQGGTTALVGELWRRKSYDSGGSGWDIDAVANDTSDELDIRVTGEASHTIDWRLEVSAITI
jgi:hypothetical protein